MKKKLIKVYAIEIITTGLFLIIPIIMVGYDRTAAIFAENVDRIIVGLYVCLGVSSTLWVAYLTLYSGEFGKYLKYKNCQAIYSCALLYVNLTIIITAIAINFVLIINNDHYTILILYLSIYSIINFISMFWNAFNLWELFSAFRLEYDRVKKKNEISDREKN